jgi:hypothetical protein
MTPIEFFFADCARHGRRQGVAELLPLCSIHINAVGGQEIGRAKSAPPGPEVKSVIML